LNIIFPVELKTFFYFLCSDEGVHWAVQNGLYLSRSTVVYFKHNDMASLASTLEKLTRRNKRTENIRRYIVVESIYQVCFFSDYFVLDKCSFFLFVEVFYFI
jgi:7-keto-8-aminopelargonate synthetase-like enzyme